MKKHKKSMSMLSAIALLIAGVILGTVFTFGMQFWNNAVKREDCITIKTVILSYDIKRELKRPTDIKEIAVNCADGKRYFIDGVSANDKLASDLAQLQNNAEVSLIIHPNSNTLLEIKTGNKVYLEFDETIDKLGKEAIGFLFLGIFLYICAVIGLYYVIVNLKIRYKR